MFRGLRPLPTLSLLFLTPTVGTVAFPFSGQHTGPHSLSDQGPFSGQSEVKSKYPKQSQRQGGEGWDQWGKVSVSPRIPLTWHRA